jgi:hypothetical protein
MKDLQTVNEVFSQYCEIDDTFPPFRFFKVKNEHLTDLDNTYRNIVQGVAERKRTAVQLEEAMTRALRLYKKLFEEDKGEDIIPCVYRKNDDNQFVIEYIIIAARNHLQKVFDNFDDLKCAVAYHLLKHDENILPPNPEYKPDPIGLELQMLIDRCYNAPPTVTQC